MLNVACIDILLHSGVLMAVDFSADHYALFGLTPCFTLDAAALDQRFRELQAEVHPDKFAHADAAQQRLAMQWSTQVNGAYQTLKSPLARAEYLLRLKQHDPEVESNTAMPMGFLVEQMELRESVAEARVAGQVDVLDDCRSQQLKAIKAQYIKLQQALDEKQDYAAASDLVRQLMFQEKLLTEIDDALEALDS